MPDDLRERVLAAVRKGPAAPPDTSKTKKPALQRYSVDLVKETPRNSKPGVTQGLSNQINDVTLLRAFSANSDSQPDKGCVAAAAAPEEEAGCKVEIIELPQAQRYRKVFAFLQLQPPALVPVERWQRCVEDGSRFLAKWGDQAEALGWSSADLFGLHIPSANPHPSYSRLSRYDETGLCWLPQGRPVVALTADTAAN